MHLNFSLGDIPSRHIPKLANVLQFRPKENHPDQEQRIKSAIKTLPSRLKGPGRLVRLLLHPRIDACEWHKNLNRCVTDVILHHIQIEIGIRLNSLVAHSELLPREHLDRVSRLRELHALWLGPETFEKTFLVATQNVPWKYQANKCDACILSCIAGNMQTLLDLRCVVSSRVTSKFVAKHGNPRLLIWVDAWIKSLVAHVRSVTGSPVPMDAQIEKNDHQSVELKYLRGKIRRLRKQLYHSAGPHRAIVDNNTDAALPVQTVEADDRIFEDVGEEIVSSKRARRKSMGNNDEDSTDADLASIDAFTALKSSEHVPLMLDPRLQYEYPYVTDEAESKKPAQANIRMHGTSESLLQPDVYIPPRQGWKQQEPTQSSNTARSHQPRLASRRDSWETIIFDSNFVDSGIMHQSGCESRQFTHQPHHRPAPPPSSRYGSAQTQFPGRHPTSMAGETQPDPATSYINVLPSFEEYGDKRSRNRSGTNTQYESTAASKSARDPARKSSSVLPARTHASPRHARSDNKGKVVDKQRNTTQDFLHAYDDLAQGLGKHNATNRNKISTSNHLASDLNISPQSRSAMLPEGLKAVKRHGDHDKNKTHSEKRGAGDAKRDATHRDEKQKADKHGEGRRTHQHQPAIAATVLRDGDKAKPNDKPDRVPAKQRREERSKPRPEPAAPANPTKTTESNATTWSAEYGSGLRKKDDLHWFYNGGRK